MKRSGPLQRKTPLRRTKFKRSRPKPNPAGSDPAHLAWIREQPCCVCGTTRDVQAHHSTVGRGLSRKTSDRETMPLCMVDHMRFHHGRGFFADWTKAMRTVWQKMQVSKYAPGEQTV